MIKVLVAALVGTVVGVAVMVIVIAIAGTDTADATTRRPRLAAALHADAGQHRGAQQRPDLDAREPRRAAAVTSPPARPVRRQLRELPSRRRAPRRRCPRRPTSPSWRRRWTTQTILDQIENGGGPMPAGLVSGAGRDGRRRLHPLARPVRSAGMAASQHLASAPARTRWSRRSRRTGWRSCSASPASMRWRCGTRSTVVEHPHGGRAPRAGGGVRGGRLRPDVRPAGRVHDQHRPRRLQHLRRDGRGRRLEPARAAHHDPGAERCRRSEAGCTSRRASRSPSRRSPATTSAPRTPRALAAAVDEALTAIASRPGPAMIEAMTDVLRQPADDARWRVTPAGAAGARSGRGRPRALAARRGRARRWCSPAAARGWRADRVVALAEALDAPVVTSFNGKGVMPPGHPLHAGSSEEEPSIRAADRGRPTSASRWARASRRSTPATGPSASRTAWCRST